MLNLDLIILIAALALTGVSVYLFAATVFKNNVDSDSLAWSEEDAPIAKTSLIKISKPLIYNFTLQHAQKIKNESYRDSVNTKIRTAGLEKELNVDEYIGMQILWGVMAPIFLLILDFSLQLGLGPILCLSLGMIGFFLPSLYCSQSKKARYNSVVVDLPFFIDLLALSTEAGLDFISAIQRIVDKTENSILADELAIVLKDIKLGSSRADALRGLRDRLDMTEVTSFCSVVIDADQTGTSIAQVLKDQSVQMRLERFVRAEKAGARASQTMLLPMMVFILPAIFVMIFAPVVIQFFYGG